MTKQELKQRLFGEPPAGGEQYEARKARILARLAEASRLAGEPAPVDPKPGDDPKLRSED